MELKADTELKTVSEKWCQRTMNDETADAGEERMFSAIPHHLFTYGTNNKKGNRI